MASDNDRAVARYMEAQDALRADGQEITDATHWAVIAEIHHRKGEWQEAQAAAAVAQAWATIELDKRLQAIARAR